MEPIIKEINTETIKEKSRKNFTSLKREKNELFISLRNFIFDFIFIILGVISASFGLKGFLLPNSFIDGGVMGISLIVAEVTGLPLSIFIILINLPFLLMAFSTISWQFALRSILAIMLLALTVHFIPFPMISDDKLLVAVFGGFFLGSGIGLAIRGGSVIDGTEVLAVFINRKTPLTIGDIILLFNVLIFSIAAYIFSIEIALYAILTYLSASKTVDFIVSGIEEYVGVTIISPLHEEIRLMIIEKLGRGCTIYSGKNGFAQRGEPLEETDIVYTLLTRLELSKLQAEVAKIDKKAFLVMHSIKDAKGGMIKKRRLD